MANNKSFKKTFTSLKNTVTISDGKGGMTSADIYTIFIAPEDLVKFAEVPSFDESDSHNKIATNLITPPTKEWQRPLDSDRVEKIGEWYGNTIEKRMMPNPILVGESSYSKSQDNGASIEVKQKTDSAGAAIEDVFDVILQNNGKCPLWILDGQHRSFGLASHDKTKKQKVPVVLLIKSPEYTMQFLAQIFTEVTTGAKPLEDLHLNWMLYSFGMYPYQKGLSGSLPNGYDKAMLSVIDLTSCGAFDGTQNEFFDVIKFNPYDKSIKSAFNYTYDSKGWVDIIAKHYFSTSGAGKMEPKELSLEIVRFLRAAKALDSHRASDSKIFASSGKHFEVLLKHLIIQFLENVDALGLRGQVDWEKHLKSHKWEKADWRLKWANQGTSSKWGRFANRAAEFVMKNIFGTVPFPNTPDVTLAGPSDLVIEAFVRTQAGEPSKINAAIKHNPNPSIHINGGLPPWTTGENREMIRVSVPDGGIGSLVDVEWKDATGLEGVCKVSRDMRSSVIDLSILKDPLKLTVTTCCFDQASKKTDIFTIQW
jgi:hypothetical protein